MKLHPLSRGMSLVVFLFLVCTGCQAEVGYQPPGIPIRIWVNSEGDIGASIAGSLPTPIGTFDIGSSTSINEIKRINQKRVLIVILDGVATVYTVEEGKEFSVKFEEENALYKQVSLEYQVDDDIVLELKSVPAQQVIQVPTARGSLVSSTTRQPAEASRAGSVSQAPGIQVPATSGISSNAPTPRPPEGASCGIAVYPPFVGAWSNRGGAAISCPTGAAFTRPGAYELFQNGLMIWHAGPQSDAGGMIYVIYNDGGWQEYTDRWVEGQKEWPCNPSPPNGLFFPVRGFGLIWCETLGGSRAKLGWATNNEQTTTVTIQPFEGTGAIVSFSGNIYFLPDGMRWR